MAGNEVASPGGEDSGLHAKEKRGVWSLETASKSRMVSVAPAQTLAGVSGELLD